MSGIITKKTFSQLLSLSIKRHGIRLHVKVAGFAAAHPADGSAVEGRPASGVVLVHQRRLRVQFGSRLWHLEFHELVGFFKAAEGHGTPAENQSQGVIGSLRLPPNFTRVSHSMKNLLKLFQLGMSLFEMGPGIDAFRVAISSWSPFIAFSHGDTYVFTCGYLFLPSLPLPVRIISTVRFHDKRGSRAEA